MTDTKNTTKDTDVMKRTFEGIVVSAKGDKTIVVKVDRVRIHRLYKKRYTVSKRYQVHDERNEFKEGDAVQFIECRPISKHKKWRVVYSKTTNVEKN